MESVNQIIDISSTPNEKNEPNIQLKNNSLNPDESKKTKKRDQFSNLIKEWG